MTPPDVFRELRRWLRTHHSVIGLPEAMALGASPADIRSLLRRGEWIRICNGVYQDAAAPPTPYQPLRAGFVALRGRGVAGGRSALWLWTLHATPPERPEFWVDYRVGNRPSGVWTVHRTRDFDAIRSVNRETILVTNPLRTLVDFAAHAAPAELTAAVDVAVAKRLVSPDGLDAEIERLACRGRSGVAALRRHLRQRGYIGAPAASVLEAKRHRIIVGAGLPLPEIEVRVEGGRYRLDVAWWPIRFAVEADGYAWHFSPEHTGRDNARRQALTAAGWSLLVYTWIEIVHEPARVGREISETFHQLSRPGETAAAGQSPPPRTPRPGPGSPGAAPAPPCG